MAETKSNPRSIYSDLNTWLGQQHFKSPVFGYGMWRFANSDSGWPYGSCHGEGIGWLQAAAVQNTWYLVADSDIQDGLLHGIAHDGSGKLTVADGGVYKIDWSAIIVASANNIDAQVGGAIDGTHDLSAGLAYADLNVATAQLPVSHTGLVRLMAGQTVELAARTITAGTPDISVSYMSLSLLMVGG